MNVPASDSDGHCARDVSAKSPSGLGRRARTPPSVTTAAKLGSGTLTPIGRCEECSREMFASVDNEGDSEPAVTTDDAISMGDTEVTGL